MIDPLLARVRKLLAKAEDPACTPEEAEAFTAKAGHLIAKYGVDQALLAATDSALDPVGDRIVTVDRPYARDKASLLAAVAMALRCRVVHLERPGIARTHLFGHATDLERVELLFTSLLVQPHTASPPRASRAVSIRPRSAAPGWSVTPRPSAPGCGTPSRVRSPRCPALNWSW